MSGFMDGDGDDVSKSDSAAYRLTDAIVELMEPSVVLQNAGVDGAAGDDDEFFMVDQQADQFAPSDTDEKVVDALEHMLFGLVDGFNDKCLLEYRKILFSHGCPSGIRGVLWKAFLGYLPSSSDGSKEAFYAEVDRVLAPKREEYARMAADYDARRRVFDTWTADEKRMYNDIRVDLPRTMMPGFSEFCGSKDLQEMLGRIIYIWSERTPLISYFQGFVDLLDMFVFCFLSEEPSINGDFRKLAMTNFSYFTHEFLAKVEADSFWCVSRLLQIMERCFTHNFLEGVDVMLEQIATLWSALVTKDVQLSFFAFRWIVCLLVREFSIPNAMLIWDSYVSLGECFPRYHLFVCAALIISNEKAIKTMDMYNIVNRLQSMPCARWSPTDLRLLLEKAILLSEQFPFPDDTSSRDRSVASRLTLSQIERQRIENQKQNSMMALPGKIVSRVERSKLTESLSAILCSVLNHFKSTGAPISMKQAKRVVAYIVIISVVCLSATGTVMAIRRINGGAPGPDTPPGTNI